VISVLQRIAPAQLPGASDLYVGYTEERESALRFYTHGPRDLAAALAARSAASYPRGEVARLLGLYNAGLSAPEPTIANAAALADPSSLCVVTGQQAGFLGGPLYTVYKIATAIRLAHEIHSSTGRKVVPIFWLASEDHDFQEVNHTFALTTGGEVRRISFGWAGAGRPLSDLPVTSELLRALRRYADATHGSSGEEMLRLVSPEPSDTHCTWTARLILRAFGKHGLVVVEPRVLAPLARECFGTAFERTAEIGEALRRSARDLRQAGFAAALDPEQAGVPFRFTASGMRVRSAREPSLAAEARERPGSFSADAALRPVLQDTLLPTAASVLGPGEMAYQAMLKPLYELFGVPQPLLVPRLTLTVMTDVEAESLARLGLSYPEITSPGLDVMAVLRNAVPPPERELFAAAERSLAQALEPVSRRAVSLDPNLRAAAGRTQEAVSRALSRLEGRAYRALLSQRGFSARTLVSLRAALFPRGSLQERVFPLPFLLQRHGPEITDEILSVGDPADFRHHVVVASRP
jgi:bacillithiol biosynthesis cysteine-adding enzyme BshC